jgi:hypothetical protein
MRVKLVQRQRGDETVAAVVSERTSQVLYACVGPDAGGVLLAAVGWARDMGYSIASPEYGPRASRRGRRAA